MTNCTVLSFTFCRIAFLTEKTDPNLLPGDEYRETPSVSPMLFEAFQDRFTSLTEVRKAIKKEGVDDCGLIFGNYPFQYVKIELSSAFHDMLGKEKLLVIIVILGDTPLRIASGSYYEKWSH